MYENAQFAIKYCFLILRNVYSSKKCVDSEINQISLKNHDGICSGNLRKVSEHLRDHFQLSCAPMPMYSTIRKHYKMFKNHALFECYSAMPVSLTALLSVGYTIVEHDFCTTCYERPPVLRDRYCWAEGVVVQDRFYCI